MKIVVLPGSPHYVIPRPPVRGTPMHPKAPVQTIHGIGSSFLVAALAGNAIIHLLTLEQKKTLSDLGKSAGNTILSSLGIKAEDLTALMNNPAIQNTFGKVANFAASHSDAIIAGIGIRYFCHQAKQQVLGNALLIALVTVPLFLHTLKRASKKGSDTHEIGELGGHAMRFIAKSVNIGTVAASMLIYHSTPIGQIINIAILTATIADLAVDIGQNLEPA